MAAHDRQDYPAMLVSDLIVTVHFSMHEQDTDRLSYRPRYHLRKPLKS